jgi:hypothetical protein
VELDKLSSETAELRSIIMASNMTSCYLIMERIAAQGETGLYYEDFRRDWIDLFKEVHRLVSRMRPRRKAR